MGKKVLFVATVDSHIELFHLRYLKMFHDKGYEVCAATNTDKPIAYADKKIKLPIERSPLKIARNLRAIRELKRILTREKFDVVHCHTPMGGVVARIAARRMRRNGTRVIYTAHGFHFYKGAPLMNWVLFYPVEWWLSRHTDTLIAINREDYERAKRRFGKRCHDIQFVPGVGVDVKKFHGAPRRTAKLRKEMGVSPSDVAMVCVGRLDRNKNQGFLIRMLSKLPDNYHLVLVGPDECDGSYQELARKLKVDGRTHFMGFREDIAEILGCADVVVSASKREGMPVNLIEAAYAGVPVVAMDARGCRDVCEAYAKGCIAKNGEEFCDIVMNRPEKLGGDSFSSELSDFMFSNIVPTMEGIYA